MGSASYPLSRKEAYLSKMYFVLRKGKSNLNKSAIKKMLPMQPGDVTKTWANIDEITRDFNYQPKTSVKTGIFNFINWYLKYKK